MEQVSPQRHSPSVVVRDDVRRAETPMSKQVVEELALHVEGNGVLGVLRRLPVSRHVPQVHRVRVGERLGVRSPELGRPRRAVAEHDLGARPHLLPAHHAAAPENVSLSTGAMLAHVADVGYVVDGGRGRTPHAPGETA